MTEPTVAQQPVLVFSWKAAWAGAMFAMGAQAFLGTALSVACQRLWMAQGATAEQAAAQLADSYYTSVGFLSFLTTLVGGVFGGLLAASLGKNRPIRHAATAGALSLLFPLMMMANPMSQMGPAWFIAWTYVVPFAAAWLGGHLYVPGRKPHVVS